MKASFLLLVAFGGLGCMTPQYRQGFLEGFHTGLRANEGAVAELASYKQKIARTNDGRFCIKLVDGRTACEPTDEEVRAAMQPPVEEKYKRVLSEKSPPVAPIKPSGPYLQ